jgi:DNA-binding MarR family transcriptional regulator
MTSAESIAAYYAIPDLDERQRKVLRCIASYPGVSRNDIARITGMHPANISSRISELLRSDRIRVSGKKRDHRTGYLLRQYEVV